jgi:putative tryptophan/tyrosine transport system substrate-binding protein
MTRRAFITLLGGIAAWPLAARAQQPMPVIGYLYSGSPEPSSHLLAAFRKGLGETGYVEGQNVSIDYRWARDENERLLELAADLVRRQVSVIVVLQSVPAALAAKAATQTIPIVFSIAPDPVQVGLVASLKRPGGNITGLNSMGTELNQKRLALLHELMPGAARFGFLVNPANSNSEPQIEDVLAGAGALGIQIEVRGARTAREIDSAFAELVQQNVDGVLVGVDLLFGNRRVQLTTLASRYAVPAIYAVRDYAEADGLMSYGTQLADIYRQGGIYAGRILKGEKPADVPVARASRFELIINLKTAKTLGLTVPDKLLALADEVIE